MKKQKAYSWAGNGPEKFTVQCVYRTSLKCRKVSWCVKLDGHDGYHFGPEMRDGHGGTSQRVARPEFTDDAGEDT